MSESPTDSEFSGRYGYDCPDCDRVVSLWDREYHRNVVHGGGD